MQKKINNIKRLRTGRLLRAGLVSVVAGLAVASAWAKDAQLEVALTAPADGAMYRAPAAISLAATVTLIGKKDKENKGQKKKSDKGKGGRGNPNERVVKVEFLQGTSVIGTATAAPYAFNWVDVPGGSYVLSARATTAKGETVNSTPVAVSVQANAAPTVTLTAPTPNTVVTAPATITVTADAQDSDGTVTQVEFFADGNLIGTATASPFTIGWPNVAAGNYSLTARATDNDNAQTTSAAVNITVNQVAQVYFIHPDHFNTPRVITNQTAQVVWRYDNTDPFGGNVPDEDPDNDTVQFVFNLRFPGQYADQETNNHYNYFRDYEPGIGRYIQSDPMGLGGGISTYAYVGSDPLGRSDPFGLRTNVPNTVVDQLRQRILEFLIEQGLVQASSAQKVGEECGNERCKNVGAGAGGPRDTHFQDWATTFCLKAVNAGSSISANEILEKCKKICLQQIRKICNPDAFGAVSSISCVVR